MKKITLLGAAGGVAKAFLGIINKLVEDPRHPAYFMIIETDFLLVDSKTIDMLDYQKSFPNIFERLKPIKLNITGKDIFKHYLANSLPNMVIDLSLADTLEMLECCNEYGIPYINSALENDFIEQQDEFGFSSIQRYLLFERKRYDFNNITSIVCSGMNPGIVQWMALDLINQNSQKKPLACYIVEHDTSFYRNKNNIKSNAIYTSWSPKCFLDEAVMNYPMFVKNGIPNFLYNLVYELEFFVKLDKKEFYGSLMPHEEVLTLGKLYDMEVAFIYRVNEHTTNLIKDNMNNFSKIDDLDRFVLNPKEGSLEGEDLVGVVVVYEDEEHFMYNSLSNKEIFPIFKCNATYFQVACGIYAAMCSILLDNLKKGVYYVDELLINTKSNYGEYIKYFNSNFVQGLNKKSYGLLMERVRKTSKETSLVNIMGNQLVEV
ncbi:S-adenosylmethionine decarboxylase related protein [Bacillus cereus]|nr:S-adenosylmethionine decarboxylase related protein [Bacillus cereus]MDA2079888.1 S-adenosylmethionine decarboxylase related protein [Bacillus cereus]MDA2085478.1 S-adenosylmethionine decarboxylase related protein [Bacillus cereus]MDA2178580.1 S-adenosylmethionine decarboxylase related protein [Bacillus cereus]